MKTTRTHMFPLFAAAMSIIAACALGAGMEEAIRLENSHITIDDILDAMGDQSVTTPVQVPRLSTVIDVCAGGYYTTALLRNGTAYTWGFLSERHPTAVPVPEPLVSLACGDYHTLGLTAGGRVYSWGLDRDGSLGRSSLFGTSTSSAPGLVEGLEGKQIVSISAALDHSVAVAASGKVYAWGLAAGGRLGTGTSAGTSAPQLVTKDGAPLLAESAACGGRRTAVIERGSGKLYLFGVGDFGALGTGNERPAVAPADITPGLEAVGCAPRKVSVGGDHTLVLCEGGGVAGFGWNEEGQLGTGALENVLVPRALVGGAGDVAAEVVASPYSNSFVLWSNGTVSGCGNAQSGVLGQIELRARTEFVSLTLLQPDVVTKVAAGFKHAAFLTSEGFLLVAGDNSFGQLGIEISN